MGLPLLLPQARHHELQERRFDPGRLLPGLRLTHPGGLLQRYLPGTDLQQDRPDEFVLDQDGRGTFGSSRVEDIQRLADRRLGIRGTEMLQPQGVAEQARNARAESIELGECVLADGDEKAGVHVLTIDGAGEFAVERSRRRVRVIEEVLLELIEQNEDRSPECLRARAQQIIERQCRGYVERLLPCQLNGFQALGLDSVEKIRPLPFAKDDNGRAWLAA